MQIDKTMAASMSGTNPQQIPRAYGFKRAWPRYIEPEDLVAGLSDVLRRECR